MAGRDSKSETDRHQARRKRVWKPLTPEQRERKREYDSLRYSAMRDQYIEYSKAYAKRYPEKRSLYSQTQNHLRKVRTRDGMTSRELAAWRSAQPKVCYWCGVKCPRDFHVDHYVSLSKGGEHQSSNLVIACAPCNTRKRDRDPIEFAKEKGRLF